MPDLFPTVDTIRYHGFIRVRGGKWGLPVVSAVTEDLCWELLMAHPATGRDVEREVCSVGFQPGKRRRKRNA